MSELREVLGALRELLGLGGWVVGLVLQWLARLSPPAAIGILAGLLLIEALRAAGVQRMGNQLVEASRANGAAVRNPLWEAVKIELLWTLPGVCWQLVTWPFRWLFGLIRRARAAREQKSPEGAGEEGAPAGESGELQPRCAGLLAASHGPVYLIAGGVTAGLVLLAVLTEPLLRQSLGLAEGQAVYDTLALGWIPSAPLLLPLSGRGPLALVLLGAAGTLLLSIAASITRLVLANSLYSNLHEKREDSQTLPLWRSHGGYRSLWRPDPSFAAWYVWYSIALGVLLLIGLVGGRQPPFRVAPYLLVTVSSLFVAWLCWITLRGRSILADPKAEEVAVEASSGAGWPEVLAVLAKRHGGLAGIEHARAPRAVGDFSKSLAAEEGVPAGVSPLLVELLRRKDEDPSDPESQEAKNSARLTAMQHRVLERLAEISRADRTGVSQGQSLKIATEVVTTAQSDCTGLTVIGPAGSGRTTLGMLAAVDHVLSCSRMVLVVHPTAQGADDIDARLRLALGRSSVRWNVSTRRCGADLAAELERGVLPDIIVADLADLLSPVLWREDLLVALGLVIVDDAEEVAGPGENHAQLLFRRLAVRIRSLRAARNPEAPTELRSLVIAGDSMHEPETWQHSLVAGVRYASPMRFEPEVAVAEARPAERFGVAVDAAPLDRGAVAGASPDGPVQVFHDLRTLGPLNEGVETRRQRLRVMDLITACELAGVPWCVRTCRDGEREEDRSHRYLSVEPRFRAKDPADAVVILLEGPWTGIEREQRRLVYAGSRVWRGLRVPVIAVLRVFDPDEGRIALQLLLDREDLRARELWATLPRPSVSAPVGVVRDRHVSAELLDRPLEVAEIKEIFGAEPLGHLRELARIGEVSIETVRTLAATGFRDLVRLRLQARAVQGAAPGMLGASGFYPPPPDRIDEASVQVSLVTDPSTPEHVWRLDAGTAHRTHYPQAIFEDSRGRFAVSGRIAERDVESGEFSTTITAAAHSGDEVSVPLRRSSVLRRGVAAGTLGGLEVRARQRVKAGKRAVDVEACAVDCVTEHVATLHLSPDGRVVKNRFVFTAESPDRVRGIFRSAGVFVYVEPDESSVHTGTRLDRDGLRLLATVIRAALGSTWRRGDRALTLVTHLDEAGELAEAIDRSGAVLTHVGSPSSRRTNRVGPEDALVLIDAQQEGNGATQAILRDGVNTLFLAAHTLLRDLRGEEDTRWRWLLLHDDTAPWSDDALQELDDLDDGWARDFWDRVATQVRAWLDERILQLPSEGESSDAGSNPEAEPQEGEGSRSEWCLRRLGEVVSAGTEASGGVTPEEASQLAAERAMADSLRPYGRYDRQRGRDLLAEIFGPRVPQAPWKTADLFAIFEWMHRTVPYVTDDVRYGEAEHVATVDEILGRRSNGDTVEANGRTLHGPGGDCEDMALLFASIASNLGARCRAVLIPGHALCQVELESRSSQDVVREIYELDARRARRRGLSPFQYPNYQAQVAKGWALVGTDEKDYQQQTGDVATYAVPEDSVDVQITVDPDGRRWLCVDEAQSRILGSVATYRAAKDGVPLLTDHRWNPAMDLGGKRGERVRFVEYRERDEEVGVWVLDRARRTAARAPRPSEEPPLQTAPEDAVPEGVKKAEEKRRSEQDRRPARRSPPSRPMPPVDLGGVLPTGVVEAHLIWRRFRWKFSPEPGGRERRYLIDVGTDESSLSSSIQQVRVSVPQLSASPPGEEAKPAQGKGEFPPRVLERARDALVAIELVRPTLDALATSLLSLLSHLRRDDDDDLAERERAEGLIEKFVGYRCLPPHFGAPRDRVRSLALALTTGTADHWARTLLHAELRRATQKSAVLRFDARGWPSLVEASAKTADVGKGTWFLSLGRGTGA